MASGSHSSSRCAGLSLSRPLLLRSTGSSHAGSVVVAHGPSCSAACGIFPGQGSNLCPLHWQADSQPLRHQGSPHSLLYQYESCFYHFFVCFLINLFYFVYFGLHWIFVAMCRLSLVAASRGCSSLQCAGFSLRWLLLLQSTGSRRLGFRSCGSRALEHRLSVVAHGLSCSVACGIFPDQGSNPCPLHWQADS